EAGTGFGADGGTVSITQNGSGGISFGDGGLIDVQALGDGGSGGTVTINTGTGGLISGGALLQADAACGTGGTVTLNMASLTSLAGAGAIVINANGHGGGVGGTVNLSLASACQDLIVGVNPGEFSIAAAGGDPGSISGDGGTLNLTSGRDLIVN